MCSVQYILFSADAKAKECLARHNLLLLYCAKLGLAQAASLSPARMWCAGVQGQVSSRWGQEVGRGWNLAGNGGEAGAGRAALVVTGTSTEGPGTTSQEE